MTDIDLLASTIHTSALSDHDYVGSKKYLIVPIPNISNAILQVEPKPKTKPPKSTCSICGYKATRKGQTERHKLKHKQLKYMACDGCEGNKTDKGYQCPDCSFIAKNSTGLRVHSKIHSKGTPYKCTECDFSGVDLKDLIRHYKEAKNLKCKHCSFTTHVKVSMVNHDRTHTFERPFSCGICGSAFSVRNNLYRHMTTHKDIKLIRLNAEDCNKKGKRKAKKVK